MSPSSPGTFFCNLCRVKGIGSMIGMTKAVRRNEYVADHCDLVHGQERYRTGS